MISYDKIYIALPVLNEMSNLPSFVSRLEEQSFKNFELYVCVNQPESWWDDEFLKDKCLDNHEAVEYLDKLDTTFPVTLIDRSSRGRGWTGKEHGVGWARKTIMDAIDSVAGPQDLIISLDADTSFGDDYLLSVRDNLNSHPLAVGLSVPYYHSLTGDDRADRAILRYEIYMRHYVLNLWRINSPYHFTALGSAMAFPVWAYRKISGMTPMKSGEDFYFLQKLVKAGTLLTWNNEKVYPEARFSDRVYFGTGPAMIKGDEGDWNSYPIYDDAFFDDIEVTCRSFPALFEKDIETPLDEFLHETFKTTEIWKPLRNNARTRDIFVKACYQKVDGLRILQYLKREQATTPGKDEECMAGFLGKYYPGSLANLNIEPGLFSFDEADTSVLNSIRDLYAGIEEEIQKKHHQS